jgi:hypothetical protein
VNIKAWLDLLNTATEEHPTPETTVVHVSVRQPNGSLSGEYTVLNERLIHATFAREDSTYNKNTVREPSPHSPVRSMTRGEPVYGTTMFGCTVDTLSSGFERRENLTFTERHQNGHKLLANLQTPKQWKELKPLFKQESTQNYLLKDAMANGLVTKKDKKYTLTAKGVHQVEGE